MLELGDSGNTGFVFVKNKPAWGENRIWHAIGKVQIRGGNRSMLISGLAGLAVGEVQADELEELRLEIEPEPEVVPDPAPASE